MELVVPSAAYLEGYLDALRLGWSPRTTDPDFWKAELDRYDAEPETFLDVFVDTDPAGRTITLPDGTERPRIPGETRWMWDGEFCGSINIRWVPGTAELPEHVLGHIGYAVVPWKQRRGYATAALLGMLDVAREVGLPHVEITTQPDNVASQKVILACGGEALGEFVEPAGYGGHIGLKYRIDLV
jgi:predicted acetyltransferase